MTDADTSPSTPTHSPQNGANTRGHEHGEAGGATKPPESVGTEKSAQEPRVIAESVLRGIRDTIDGMDTWHHIEILRILTEETRDEINENSYGVHVNLSELPPSTIDRIQLYIKYVKTNEKNINDIESIKTQYRDAFFDK